MATAPKESSTYQPAGNFRQGGGGGGGKIRKPTYRNIQTTPYDRPLTALRNSNNSVRNTNGWLSRLIDPASKIINSSARKILSSVFSNRILPSIAPKPPASDAVLQSTDTQQGTSSMVRTEAEQSLEDVEVAEIEQMLKQKRFTRYEIDRLTTLLQSRTVNGSIRGEDGNPSINLASEQVFDEDIASPLELAKAYMSSRGSKYTQPTSDSRDLALNSWTPNMQKSASMKGSELRTSAHELSASKHQDSAFKNASIKRRSSALHDQYGSIGSIRRVRQKLNLINSKGVDSLVGERSPPFSKSTDKTVVLADTPTPSVDPAPAQFNEASQAQQTSPLNQLMYPQNKALSNEISGSSAEKYLIPSTSASENLVSKKFRNLEKGESSGVIKDTELDNTMDYSRDTVGDAGNCANKDGMSSKNDPTQLNSLSTENISDAKLKINSIAETTYSSEKDSGVGSLQKRHAFCMSVLEDFIDMDEDDTKGALSPNISASPDEERHPMTSSVKITAPVGSTAVNEGPSAVLPSDGAFSLSSQSAIPNGVYKLPTEAPLRGKADYSLNTSDRASSQMFSSSPIAANASSGTESQTLDSKLETQRFGSHLAVVDSTSKQKEGDKVSVLLEARHLLSTTQADPVVAAPALENSSIFSFGNAANKGSPFNSSSGSSLQSTALRSNSVGDSKQNELPATNSTILGSNNGQISASDCGRELTNVKQYTDGSEILPSTSSGTSNNTAASLIVSPAAQLHTPGTSTETHFASSTPASTNSLFGSLAPTVKSFDEAFSSDPGVSSFAASSTSASSVNATSNILFGASSTTACGTGFTFGASATPGQTTAATTNISSTTPITFGVASTSGSTTPATTSAGFSVGGSSIPANVTSSSGVSFGTSSAAANTISTAGFSFGVSSTLAITSSGLPSEGSSKPASTGGVFSFGASSTPATRSGFAFGGLTTPVTTSGVVSVGASATPTSSSSVFSFGASSTPATTSSVVSVGASSTPTSSGSMFSFGASSTPATTSSVSSFGASSTPATTNSVFSFGGSSTPATASSSFPIGGWSTPAVATTNAGIPSTMASSPAATTTISGFSFGAQSTTGTTAVPSSAPAGATSPAFLFGASSTSTPVTSTSGFLSGSSPTPATPFSFGAASTLATSAANNSSPFGFMAGGSTFPFPGTTNNTSAAQPLFGNTNSFGVTAAANNNTPAAQPSFGNTNPFGATATVNQTSMEDSMAEDSMQTSSPTFPAFGAQQTANTSGFGFGAPNPSGTSNSFQFASQPNPSNPSPFQSSGSLGFSLGSTGGGDKANRRIIKPKKGVRRK